MADDGESQANRTAQRQQYELLGLIQVISFTASPPHVLPFGTTTLSWELRPPKTLLVPVTLSVGGRKGLGLSGSASFTLSATTQFAIAARTPLVDRFIRALTVTVDESVCKSGSVPADALVITIEGGIRQQLQGSGGFSLRSGPTVTLSDLGISIVMSLNLGSDGNMDLAVVLGVQLGPDGTVRVTVPSVDVHVSLSGVATLCEGAVQSVAQAFVTEIVKNQLATQIRDGLTSEVEQLASSAHTADAQHREFRLTALLLTSSGVSFTVCPM